MPVARGGRQVMMQAPKSDIYVTLLGVAFGAVLLGILLMVLVLADYGFELKAP